MTMPGLFGGGQQAAPATPQVAVAAPIPDSQAPAVTEASNNAAMTATRRAGRSSTVVGRQAPGTAADTFSAGKLGNANQ